MIGMRKMECLFLGLWTCMLGGVLCRVTSENTTRKHLKTPPLPLLPLPSNKQLKWQESERALFFHYGLNTFTSSEWGSGHEEDLASFNPLSLNTQQWTSIAKKSGFSRVVLTAKHHDGFCLWNSSYTDYSVSSTPWRGGLGDIVSELSMSCYEEGIDFGVYLSPWDIHAKTYGHSLEYNEFYIALLTELLTSYGPIAEVWLDGAKGKDAPDTVYYFKEWFSVIRQLQPNAIILSGAGPDARWVGNEDGESGSTSWGMVNISNMSISSGKNASYSQQGDMNGVDWMPSECDVSIRPGWFCHENEKPKSVNSLLQIYYKSVGRNCVLLLNVPPNTAGLISQEDAEVLFGFKEALQRIFSRNLVDNAHVRSDGYRGLNFRPDHILSNDLSTYWAPEQGKLKGYLELDMGAKIRFNVVRIQEAIHMGQRVIAHHVDVLKEDGEWATVVTGTTIGYKRLELLVVAMEAQLVRLYIDESRAEPLIASFGLYFDPITCL